MPRFTLRAWLIAGVLLASPALVEAKSYTIPDPNPVAVITIPDDWEATEIAKGVEAQSDDDAVYVAIEVTELKDAAQAISEAVIWLKSKDVVIDESTQVKEPFSVNGLDGVQVKWNGKDEDGPTHVSLTLLQVTDTKGLILTYWASPAGEKDNLPALVAMINSLRAIK